MPDYNIGYGVEKNGICSYLGCKHSTNFRANALMCGSITSITSHVLLTSATTDPSFSTKVLVVASSRSVPDNTLDLNQDSML